MESKKMTVREAIEQGYKYYTMEDYPETMRPIKDAETDENLRTSDCYLLSKEYTILKVEPSDIYTDLAENFAINNEVADGDDSFSDLIIEAVDWDDIAKKINESLADHPVYFPTKIKLIPNGK